MYVLKLDGTPVKVKIGLVAPLYTPPSVTFTKLPLLFSCHWYVKPVPVADTLKLVVFPSQIVALVGEVVITGAKSSVSKAEAEVVEGLQTPDTTTR